MKKGNSKPLNFKYKKPLVYFQKLKLDLFNPNDLLASCCDNLDCPPNKPYCLECISPCFCSESDTCAI